MDATSCCAALPWRPQAAHTATAQRVRSFLRSAREACGAVRGSCRTLSGGRGLFRQQRGESEGDWPAQEARAREPPHVPDVGAPQQPRAPAPASRPRHLGQPLPSPSSRPGRKLSSTRHSARLFTGRA
eukprot:353243-Chlamydomonas_euryale.AAC.1